jgi:hypothetical protein
MFLPICYNVHVLIKGFETPFGMELLSTVHWVATKEKAKTAAQAIEKTYSWNERKRMFKEEHITIAWKVLEQKERAFYVFSSMRTSQRLLCEVRRRFF